MLKGMNSSCSQYEHVCVQENVFPCATSYQHFICRGAGIVFQRDIPILARTEDGQPRAEGTRQAAGSWGWAAELLRQWLLEHGW